MFGVIFHWGLYSVPAFDDIVSARKRKIQNGSEWYQKRLLEKSTFRPTSGWKETQEYHEGQFANQPYHKFSEQFDEESINFNPQNWAQLCKKNGAQYVILTAKHHDGFCLWETKTTEFHSKVDHLKNLKKALDDVGIDFGIYYSWTEFTKGCTQDYMNNIMIPQIKELITYQPKIFWFDGDWNCKTKIGQTIIDQLCQEIKIALPGIKINDRIGHKEQRDKNPNYLGLATYRVYDDRALPTTTPLVQWEHINTIGLSWGLNEFQEPIDYKSPDELMELYSKVKSLGGNFLLNLGPKPDGSLDPNEEIIFNDFGQLLNISKKNQVNLPKIKLKLK
jgi:alpha-L-fucosidase